MPKYLSQEWLDAGREASRDFPERPGASVRMQYHVTGGPEGDVRYYQVVENGKVTESTLGTDPAADVTLTVTYDDSVRVQNGEVDVTAAFMDGRIKVTGDMGKLLSLLPITQSPEYKAIQEQIRGLTEY